MQLAKFMYKGEPRWGAIEGKNVRLLVGSPYENIEYDSDIVQFDELDLLPPCDATKIVAVGKAYRDHVAEFDGKIADEPVIFLKPTTALTAHMGNIVIPTSATRVDYEGELALVVKKTAKGITPEEASDYILGFTCLNDVTERHLQKKDGQWTRAKSFDTFAPLGPFVQTTLDPNILDIETLLNGETVQKSNTSLLLWNVHYLFSFVSNVMTLNPGDVVTTGTPSGIGPMKPGDRVEVSISGIGSLINFVV